MKYIVFIFSCSIFLQTLKVTAQIEKGNWSLGVATTLSSSGNSSALGFGYSVNKSDGLSNQTETFQFNFTPRVGYVIIKDLSLGLDINVTYFNSSENTNTFIGAGPFARYYFKGNYLRPYIEVQGSYGNTSVKSESPFFGNQNFDIRYFSAGGAFGLAFPIKNIVHIDLAAAYNSRFEKIIDDDIEINNYSIGLKLGVTVFFDKAKNSQN